MGYVMLQGHVLEETPDGKLVDPVLMRIIRHHAATGEQREDLITLARGNGFDRTMLAMLLKYMGSSEPLLMSSIGTTRTSAPGPASVTCRISIMDGQYTWDGLRVTCNRKHKLPDQVIAALSGRPLGDLIEHPYLPEDLEIGTVDIRNNGWMATIAAPEHVRPKHRKKDKCA